MDRPSILTSMFTALLDRIVDSLPSQCLICRAWPAQPLCADCVGRYTSRVLRCTTCALPVPEGIARCGACLRDPPPFDACHAGVDYGWPWTACIARFKFHSDPHLARPLAALLTRDPAIISALAQADCVLSIPMTPQRIAERGYNPAWLLARRLAPHQACADALLRTREAAPQRQLGRAERRRNLRGAFIAHPAQLARLRDQRVVLVDDVMTTGATLREAARVLRQAGAAHITAIALARTPEPGA